MTSEQQAGARDHVAELDIIASEPPPPSRLSESIVLITAIGAAVCGVGFGVSLIMGAPLFVHGGLLALALLLFGAAVRRYFADTYPDVEAVEAREIPTPADEDLPLSDVPAVPNRRSFVKRVLLVCGGIFGIGIAAPPIASLGPAPAGTLRKTAWENGRRLVGSDGQPIKPEDVAGGGIASIWPEDAIGEERSAVILIRLNTEPQPPTVAEWVIDDTLVAYSKVCTHAGCPVALFRERDNALFCPCHQSTFAPARGAEVTFGPAERPLPQLPLGTDQYGYLIALGDFREPVGPASNTGTT